MLHTIEMVTRNLGIQGFVILSQIVGSVLRKWTKVIVVVAVAGPVVNMCVVVHSIGMVLQKEETKHIEHVK